MSGRTKNESDSSWNYIMFILTIEHYIDKFGLKTQTKQCVDIIRMEHLVAVE